MKVPGIKECRVYRCRQHINRNGKLRYYRGQIVDCLCLDCWLPRLKELQEVCGPRKISTIKQ